MQERRYDIKSLIARGGMAEVWLATLKGVDGFQKKVVLKTILPKLAEDPEFVRMFINEALLAARLSHPNVVQIQDLGKIKGQYYIAMEYVYGRSLRQIARQCRKGGSLIPPWFLLRVMGTVCEGLQYAHDFAGDDGKPLGLVHRDVTPENIMVSFMGEVKILDFGVAKATTAATETRAGLLKGKYAYISPEQVKGKKPDRRCDIYSVGVILYELLTGTRPFKGANELALLRQVLAGDFVKPKEIAPWIPDELQQIILHALESDPDKRYPEISQLGNDIQALLQLARDHHSNKDLGMFVGSLFPEETNVKSDVKKLSTGTLSLSPTSSPGSLSAFLTSGSALAPDLENNNPMMREAIAGLPQQAPLPAASTESLSEEKLLPASESMEAEPLSPQATASQDAELDSEDDRTEDKKAAIKQKARSWFRRVVGVAKGDSSSKDDEIVDLSEPKEEMDAGFSGAHEEDTKESQRVAKKPEGPQGWGTEVTAKTRKPLGSRTTPEGGATGSGESPPSPVPGGSDLRPTQPMMTAAAATDQATPGPQPTTRASTPPASPRPEPVVTRPAPVTPRPAPVTPRPAPVTPRPAPVTPRPASATPRPASATPRPASATPRPAPAAPRPEPTAARATPPMPRPEAAVSKPAQPVEPQTDLPTTEELPSLAPELKQAEVGSPDSPASLFSESTADMEKPKTGPTLFDSNATASSGSSEKVADLFGGSRVESFMEPGDAFSASSKNRNETEDGVTSIFDLYSVDPSTRQTNSGYREANPFAVGGIEEKKTESDSLGTPSFAIRESANAATQDEALAEEDHSTDVGDSPRALASQHFENGLASVRAGRLEEALQDWQSALKLDPDNRVYKMNIKKLMERMEREAN